MILTTLELMKIEARICEIESKLEILDPNNSFEALEAEALCLELEVTVKTLEVSIKNALRRERIENSGLRLVK